MEISRREFNALVNALAGLCDSCKRLERAIETGDRSYLETAKEKREATERAILKLGESR